MRVTQEGGHSINFYKPILFSPDKFEKTYIWYLQILSGMWPRDWDSEESDCRALLEAGDGGAGLRLRLSGASQSAEVEAGVRARAGGVWYPPGTGLACQHHSSIIAHFLIVKMLN